MGLKQTLKKIFLTEIHFRKARTEKQIRRQKKWDLAMRCAVYVPLVPAVALTGEMIYNLERGPPVDSSYSICQRDQSKCMPDFSPIPGAQLKQQNAVYGINQEGYAVALRGFLQKDSKNPFVQNYIRRKIIKPNYIRAHKTGKIKGAGEQLFGDLWVHLAKNFNYSDQKEEPRKDRSYLERILDYSWGIHNNQSLQTFEEFVKSNYTGDCDDISHALYVGTQVIKEHAAVKRHESAYWKSVHSFFSKNRIVIVELDGHVTNALLHYDNTGVMKGYKILNSQSTMGGGHKHRFKDGRIQVQVNGEWKKLIGMYSANAVYGTDKRF